MNMLQRDKLWDYWRNPPAHNQPEKYAAKPYSHIIVDLVEKYKPANEKPSILELGCNMGRNLAALYKAGYHDLTGIDINPGAIAMMRLVMPEAKAYEGAIEDVLPGLGNYDLIFTMATLCHLHPDSDFVFKEIAQRAGLLITIENEYTDKLRHCGRNYKAVFEALGMQAVYRSPYLYEISHAYIGRVFEQPAAEEVP